jgi:hypothetical protein
MIRSIIAALFFFSTLGIEPAQAQQAVTFKRFVSFKQIVPGIDFYASSRQIIAPYEKPAAAAMDRLKVLFGAELPKGAIFICSTLEQKDSIYEPMVLKQGYSWMLAANTPDVRIQEMMARMKSQMGGQVPAEVLDRIKNRPPEMLAEAEKQTVTTVIQQVAYAVMQTLLNKDLRYRSNRLDDMSKIPLQDWLDIGIAAYVSDAPFNVAYLQQNFDQTFPMEDVIAMSRPFVASSTSDQNRGNGSGGGGMNRMGGGEAGGQGGGGFPQGMPQGAPSGVGQGMPQGGFSGRGMGGSGGFGGNGGRGGAQRTIPKDEQDRMLFDGQASTFFAYMIDKVGIEKVKQLVKYAVEGKESREFILQADVLGPDFSKIEENWAAWVKTLKAPQTPRQGNQGPF